VKRIWHSWEKWECVASGMYSTECELETDLAKQRYAAFLRDTPGFQRALERVLTEWPISCEQFLSNESTNRIAWLGQASMCIATGIPRKFRGGFMLLTPEEQRLANATANETLQRWLGVYEKANSTLRKRVVKAWVPGWYSRRGSWRANAARAGSVIQSNLFCHS
jgi:hypothetical protein